MSGCLDHRGTGAARWFRILSILILFLPPDEPTTRKAEHQQKNSEQPTHTGASEFRESIHTVRDRDEGSCTSDFLLHYDKLLRTGLAIEGEPPQVYTT